MNRIGFYHIWTETSLTMQKPAVAWL